ncbi:MAG: M1 family metallopeptidase [Clostridia bacterium]|nr:M1 family metallopeptidase [Clostridia bacterium]
MKKKRLFIGIVVVVCVIALCAFVLCSNNLATEENYCYYKQELFFNEQEHLLDGKQTVGFFNYTDVVLTQVCLHLYPNAFREGAKAKVVSLANQNKAYPNGLSYGNIAIESVSCGENYLTYEIGGEDENILIIEFGKELFPDESIEFEIGFSVSLANVNHRLGYGENTINLCNYYPILCVYENGGFVTDLYHSNGDPFYSKVANYEVEITYPSEYILASTGRQSTEQSNANKTTKMTANKIRDFAMVLSRKFNNRSDSFEGVQINYFYYGDKSADLTVETIKQVLAMNKKYGSYPYETLTVCEANFVHGGMEYPGLVLIADNLSDRDTYVNVVVHELCHQWWYGVVGNNQYAYGFLDEGLTDFNTALFYDEYPEYGWSSKEIFANAQKSYNNFVKIFGDVVTDFKTDMLKPLNKYTTENEYVYLSYVKGMLMFASLNDMLGEAKMTKCLKYYYNQYAFKEATPNDMVIAFCKASGKNLTSFFESWFNGSVVMGEF